MPENGLPMNCFNHPTEPAVASCQDCHKGLCPDCTSRYTVPICESCNRKRIASDKKVILIELVITLVVGLAFMVFAGNSVHSNPSESFSGFSQLFTYVGIMYMGCSIVADWKTLTAITPNIFLFLPILGWVFFFIVKLFVSMFIGPWMLPIRWFRHIMRWRELNQIEALA